MYWNQSLPQIYRVESPSSGDNHIVDGSARHGGHPIGSLGR